ncbi:hypothetical protein GEMRC1_000358 [Eukaryota sp. GEM-RC1]
MISVVVEFGGGVDEYFHHKTSIRLTLNPDSSFNELFSLLQENCTLPVTNFYDNGVKPGYMLLVNDADYELVGHDYRFENNDNVALISLVHGG